MKRYLVLCSTLLMLISMAGCADDHRDSLITNTINQMNAAATAYGSIKAAINDAMKKAEKEKGSLAAKDFEEAIKQTETLKNIGQKMQEIKQQSDALKEALSKEEKTKKFETFQEKLRTAFTRMSEEQDDLNKTLAQAKKMQGQEDALATLLDRLKDANNEFIVMAKQR